LYLVDIEKLLCYGSFAVHVADYFIVGLHYERGIFDIVVLQMKVLFVHFKCV